MLKTLKKNYNKHTQIELISLLKQVHPSQTKEIKKIVRLLRMRATQYGTDGEKKRIMCVGAELSEACATMADGLIIGDNKVTKLFIRLYELACFLYGPTISRLYEHHETASSNADRIFIRDAIAKVVRQCIGGAFVCSKPERKSLIHVLRLIALKYNDNDSYNILNKASVRLNHIPIIKNHYSMGSGSPEIKSLRNKIWDDLGSREPVDMVAIRVTGIGGSR